MSDDKRTRAELLAAIASADEWAAEMQAERDAWRNAKQADKEAEAISACVKALDLLRGVRVSGTIRLTQEPGDIGRVLRYLADRYVPPGSALTHASYIAPGQNG